MYMKISCASTHGISCLNRANTDAAKKIVISIINFSVLCDRFKKRYRIKVQIKVAPVCLRVVPWLIASQSKKSKRVLQKNWKFCFEKTCLKPVFKTVFLKHWQPWFKAWPLAYEAEFQKPTQNYLRSDEHCISSFLYLISAQWSLFRFNLNKFINSLDIVPLILIHLILT